MQTWWGRVIGSVVVCMLPPDEGANKAVFQERTPLS
jgi:hypothetical protein